MKPVKQTRKRSRLGTCLVHQQARRLVECMQDCKHPKASACVCILGIFQRSGVWECTKEAIENSNHANAPLLTMANDCCIPKQPSATQAGEGRLQRGFSTLPSCSQCGHLLYIGKHNSGTLAMYSTAGPSCDIMDAQDRGSETCVVERLSTLALPLHCFSARCSGATHPPSKTSSSTLRLPISTIVSRSCHPSAALSSLFLSSASVYLEDIRHSLRTSIRLFRLLCFRSIIYPSINYYFLLRIGSSPQADLTEGYFPPDFAV